MALKKIKSQECESNTGHLRRRKSTLPTELSEAALKYVPKESLYQFMAKNVQNKILYYEKAVDI
jgi:hypothetical protein